MVPEDEKFMALAMKLAARGRGKVEPNPMVGAVIVRDGREISRGWHGAFGSAHAEVEAIVAARSARQEVRGATMYVTLEPCSHHGKTPPCTRAIIEAGIKQVVVAMEDPDEKVSGRGVAALRAAGIGVSVGVLEERARELLAAYIKLRTTGRPWVICKWAQTTDGFLARPPGQERWISNERSRKYVHRLRGRCDGICIGVNTVIADDPLLTNRSGGGKQPVRVILDSRLRMPCRCKLLDSLNISPVIVATTEMGISENPMQAEGLCRHGVELLKLPADDRGVELGAMLDELGRRGWTYLLVEGGARVLESFIGGLLADELLVFVSGASADGDATGLPKFDIARVCHDLALGEAQRRSFGEDVLLRYVLRS